MQYAERYCRSTADVTLQDGTKATFEIMFQCRVDPLKVFRKGITNTKEHPGKPAEWYFTAISHMHTHISVRVVSADGVRPYGILIKRADKRRHERPRAVGARNG